MIQGRESIVLEIVIEKDPLWPPRPESVRLRHWLKRMLRDDGFRVKRLCDAGKVDIVIRPQPQPDGKEAADGK